DRRRASRVDSRGRVGSRAAPQGGRRRHDHASSQRPPQGQRRRDDHRGSRAGDGEVAMATLPDLLKTTLELDGSDLHIASGTPPQVRVHGSLRRLDLPELSPSDTKQLIYTVLTRSEERRV